MVYNNTINFIDTSPGAKFTGRQTDLVQTLLYQIVRVKGLIKYYEDIPDGAGQLGAAILHELVSEAYTSLVNYDTILMHKYYDLLMSCD